MKASLAALLFLAWTADGMAAQEATSPAEGMRLLRQMANAARELTYTGTFVYKHGGQMETSRIWHLTDATGDYERLETLDGPPREVVRANEQVTCFYPGDKTAKVEQWTAARRFPAVVSEQLSRELADRGRTLSLAELGAKAGAGQELMADLLGYGLLHQQESGYDEHALGVVKACVELQAHGIEPRHLRGLRAAAEREAGLVERAIAPSRRSDAAGRARTAERALELARSRATRLGALEPAKAFGRLSSFLMRRGYAPDVARSAARTALRVDEPA